MLLWRRARVALQPPLEDVVEDRVEVVGVAGVLPGAEDGLVEEEGAKGPMTLTNCLSESQCRTVTSELAEAKPCLAWGPWLPCGKPWSSSFHTTEGNSSLLFWLVCSEVPFDTQLLQRYRKALDTSVKIATVHNVKPIRGSTVIFCNLSHSMRRPCTSAKGLGKPRLVRWICLIQQSAIVPVFGALWNIKWKLTVCL